MKYLRTKSQLNDLIASSKPFIIIFVDPNEFMPAKLLLNFFYSHGTTQHIDTMLWIWHLVDQEIYNRYNVIAFPQFSVIKGEKVLYSSLGYNREKAN